jgi:hypothetical protein
MDGQVPHARRMNRLSWTLLASLMPMLTFMGHWPSEIPLPGTNSYISLGPEAAHTHSHSEDEASHSHHCHGDSAGCSEAPVTAGVTFGMMNEAVALAIAAGLFFAAWAGVAAVRSQRSLAPEPRPPRAVIAPA